MNRNCEDLASIIPATPVRQTPTFDRDLAKPANPDEAGHFVIRIPSYVNRFYRHDLKASWVRIESDIPINVALNDRVVSVDVLPQNGLPKGFYTGEAVALPILWNSPLEYVFVGQIDTFQITFTDSALINAFSPWGLVHVYYGNGRVQDVKRGRPICRATEITDVVLPGVTNYKVPLICDLGSFQGATNIRPLEVEVTDISFTSPEDSDLFLEPNLFYVGVQDPTGTFIIHYLWRIAPVRTIGTYFNTVTGLPASYVNSPYQDRYRLDPPLRIPYASYYRSNPGSVWPLVVGFRIASAPPAQLEGEAFVFQVNWRAV